MKFRLARYNSYLCLFLALASVCACHTDPKEKKAPKAGYSVLRLNIEVNADGTDKNGPVTIGAQEHFTLNVNKLPFVDENHLAKVSVVEDEVGGFMLRVELNRQGTWLLEQYTVAHRGRHIAVFAELEDFHWIAAPLITKKISDGVFTFTPYTSRAETEKLALGLTKEIKHIRSLNTFNE